MITNEVINEIRNKVNIVDIISNYVPLTKKGKNYFVFHVICTNFA